MQFQGAVILALGKEVGLVIVEPDILNSKEEYEEISVLASRSFGLRTFGYVPIVLVAFDTQGVPTLSGPSDLVDFLVDVDLNQIAWEVHEV